MGPVIFITGKNSAQEQVSSRKQASMGPVIFITGKDTLHQKLGALGELQWGR